MFNSLVRTSRLKITLTKDDRKLIEYIISKINEEIREIDDEIKFLREL